MFVLTTNAK